MLADLRDGTRDGVIVYHVDRLTRRPIELEEFVAVVDAAKVRHVQFVAGDMDLRTGDGLHVRPHPGRHGRERLRGEEPPGAQRKMDQIAEEGRPNGGPRARTATRPTRSPCAPDEAAVIRTMVAAVPGRGKHPVPGGVAQRRGHPHGEREGVAHTRRCAALIVGGRIAGLREHRGEIVGPAAWEPIISRGRAPPACARMASAATSAVAAPRSGTCCPGCCAAENAAASSTPRPAPGTRRYVCLSGPDNGGCGRLTVVAEHSRNSSPKP